MRTSATIAALALTVIVGACGGRQQPEFTRADAETVRKTASDLAGAFNAKNIDALAAMYSPESVFMPPNAPLVRGRDAIRPYFTDILAKGATDLQLQPGDVGGYGTLAYQSGTYSLSYEGNAGMPPRDRGKYLFVLRNTNGRWLFEHTIWSSDLPPHTPAAPAQR